MIQNTSWFVAFCGIRYDLWSIKQITCMKNYTCILRVKTLFCYKIFLQSFKTIGCFRLLLISKPLNITIIVLKLLTFVNVNPKTLSCFETLSCLLVCDFLWLNGLNCSLFLCHFILKAIHPWPSAYRAGIYCHTHAQKYTTSDSQPDSNRKIETTNP